MHTPVVDLPAPGAHQVALEKVEKLLTYIHSTDHVVHNHGIRQQNANALMSGDVPATCYQSFPIKLAFQSHAYFLDQSLLLF